jgi:hypothetical protein
LRKKDGQDQGFIREIAAAWLVKHGLLHE